MVGTHVDFDTVLELCGDEHRRIVLGVLADQRRRMTVNDLAKAIVRHNHHVSPTEVSEETATRVRIALHHVHIPKLVASGVVEYDSERRLVEPTEEFDRVEPHLSAILDADPGLSTPIEP